LQTDNAGKQSNANGSNHDGDSSHGNTMSRACATLAWQRAGRSIH